MTSPHRIPAERLRGFIAEAFEAVDIPPDDAGTIADLMTRIDLRGLDGHGIFRLPPSIKRIKAGGINVNPALKIVRETASTALIDGDNGVGHLAVNEAARVAMDKAGQNGVAWVGTTNCNHAGAGSIYAMMPMERDMIGLYMAVGSANHLPPWGGIEMLLSTNPLACAIPGLEEPPIVLDMATTVASYGKVKIAADRGQTMPEGWMIDPQGNPLTDPTRSDDGFLLPIGGYKGYGLALIFGLLAGTLNGAAMGKDVIDFNKDFTSTTNTGQLIIALDIKAFADVETFKRNVDGVIRAMKGSPTLPGVEEIFLPGEQSHAKWLERTRDGVPIPEALMARLVTLAAELKIDPLV
ncbi:MAG: Ldh family oxidoreductase [Proteobacteria bacterium]|nr:Ldh family oxidoreductase [Pseudomonadota bacterium]